jgi:antitoxin component YwqK of YwqJK toxin-antitoxin module
MKKQFKLVSILLLSIQFIQNNCSAQQNTIDNKKVYLYYIKVNHSSNNNDLFLKYLKLFKKDEYNLYKNDEFSYSKFINDSKTEYLTAINNLDFNTKFTLTNNIQIGEYNFGKNSFPLDNDIPKYFGNLNTIYNPAWPLKDVRVAVFNSQHLDMELKMIESKANAFIQSRKSSNGIINRNVSIKIEYSIMNNGSIRDGKEKIDWAYSHETTYLGIYIYKITLLDGQNILHTIFPDEDYYDKVNGYKLKEGSEKIFYGNSANELRNEDSLRAVSYRIINYKDGKFDNPVIDYYMNGQKQIVGNYSDYWGTKNGSFTWFYENGQKFKEATYVNNNLDGSFRSWYSNGDKQEEVTYVNGQKDGCDYMWDADGKCLSNSILGGWTYSDHFSYYRNGTWDSYSKECPCVKRTGQNANAQENNNPNSNQKITLNDLAGTFKGLSESAGSSITINSDESVVFIVNGNTFTGKTSLKRNTEDLEGAKRKIKTKLNKTVELTDYNVVFNYKSDNGTKDATFALFKDGDNFLLWGGGDSFFENNPGTAPSSTNTNESPNSNVVNPGYTDHYNSQSPEGEYKLFDNSVYYKSNNLEIISISVNDVDRNIITNAQSKVGYPIFLKIKIKGLTTKGGKTKFTLSKYEEDTNGTLVSTQTEKEEGDDNPTISIAGGVRMFPNNNMNSMTVHLSFSIKDRNSDSIIHGFFDYTAVK